ncbi:Star-like isoform X2 [Brachionus plicatilis]|uniref:Star-like isoform X2 n=1 Tax=Brachionus plicatilis TaxID=10195 RepID=A0A3M7Q5X4_BRAPC|nr:Star-like isoform X2 [Brachionus plicatilis]
MEKGTAFDEALAFDGETFSNSLFFEKERDFSGILIEPLPLSYERLLEKNKKFYSINACIAQKVPTVAKFKMFKRVVFSGRSKSFKYSKNEPPINEFIYVPCFSIQTILAAINVKTVDLFSLDVEGVELDVLRSINFDRIKIKSFVIEHKHSSKDHKGQMFFLYFDLSFQKKISPSVTPTKG